MKFLPVMAVIAATLLLATGCSTRRDNDNNTSSGVASSIESGAKDLESKAEEGADRLRSDLESDDSRMEKGNDNSISRDSQTSGMVPNSSSSSSSSQSESSNQAAPAMSTDFSEIGAHDNTTQDGFPGGPVDDLNRPSGPMSYQEKYGEYGAYFIVPDSQKIYLTFDEGYENGYTSKILDVLKEKNVKAVFFITYPYAKSEPSLVQRMVDEGHVLGNHSTAHKVFPEMPLSEAADDLMNLHDYVKAQFGYEMYLFRPPEGKFSQQTLALAQSLGYKTMLWSFAYKDYDVNAQPLTIEAVDRIVSYAHPGEICLLHAVSKTNAEALGDVIDTLRDDGFEFADYFGLS